MTNAAEESSLISSQCKILTKLLSMETRCHFSRRCVRLPYRLPLQSCKLRAAANSRDASCSLRASVWFSCKESYKTHTWARGRVKQDGCVMHSLSPFPALIFSSWSECNLVNWSYILSRGLWKLEPCIYWPAQTLPHLPAEHELKKKKNVILVRGGSHTALPRGGGQRY